MTNLDSDFEFADDAIENGTTLANCWLALQPGFDCGATMNRVADVVKAIVKDDCDELVDFDVVDEAELCKRLQKASFALCNWLKFEHHTKPILDSGSSTLRLQVKVADLKDPAKNHKYRTPAVSATK